MTGQETGARSGRSASELGGPATCLCIVGTRPEAIKMAPVVKKLQDTDWAHPTLVATGQHVELLALALEDFSLKPDIQLVVDRSAASLSSVLAQVIVNLDRVVQKTHPACIVAQGDTTTVAGASLVAFHARIPFVHVEAGLRTGDLTAPFPEEFYRRIATLGATLHCAPTDLAQRALLKEGISPSQCPVTGNTVIDALLATAAGDPAPPKTFPQVRRPILVTAHRRENQGDGLRNAFEGLRRIADAFDDIGIFFPVHPNPETREPAREILGNHPRIVLADPLCYRDLVACLQKSWLVITDSGGLQEEAPALGRPVLVLRDVTERPEAVATEVVRLVGTSAQRIFDEVAFLHGNEEAYRAMARAVFPYGDGEASGRIVGAMRAMLGR